MQSIDFRTDIRWGDTFSELSGEIVPKSQTTLRVNYDIDR